MNLLTGQNGKSGFLAKWCRTSEVSVATFAVMIEARFQIDCYGKGLLFHSLLTFQTPSALTLISIALDQMPNATNGF